MSSGLREGDETHRVENQPPPLEGGNLYAGDRPLVEAVAREGGRDFEGRLVAYGTALGQPEAWLQARQANTGTPTLRTHDRFGHRIDEVEFHPAWHAVMQRAMAQGLHNLPWNEPRGGAHVARAALVYLHCQVESGSMCPLTMTFASLPALRHEPQVAAEWEPLLLGTEYEAELRPVSQKRSALIGMAMTEKQGGSDVRANTTRAVPVGEGAYELVGHKWFCSAPMCDAFLTLAQTERGLTCFLVPRFRPDGSRNAFALQRLKDKLGNRSNASSEVEYRHTWARRLGEEGRGVRTIIDMVHHTRLDCVSSSAGLMRQALAQAMHHAEHRSVFGRRLLEQPLMRNVLADLALEVEASAALALRLARAYDEAPQDPAAAAFARIATAVGKYQVCKRAPAMIYEAMECLGGNGYVEESVLPRLYREAPVNAIWEGSGNVICLDVLRALVREPECLPALLDEIREARGGHPALAACCDGIERELADPAEAELRARRVVERMALALQASLLVRGAPSAVADAFCGSRLGGDVASGFGTLPSGTDFGEILGRAAPAG